MLTIAPTKQFLVDLKLNNPADTGTYYVRCVIKNAVSGETLDTLDLTDNGGKYFSKLWLTPPDASGSGLQVTLTKTVYEDSGYTQESLNYGTTVENYIIKDSPSRFYAGGMGGHGSGLTREQVVEAVKEAISSLPEVDPKIPEIPEVDLSPILEALKGIDTSGIAGIDAKLSAIKPQDMSGIEKGLSVVADSVTEIKNDIVSVDDGEKIQELKQQISKIEDILLNISKSIEKVAEYKQVSLDDVIPQKPLEKLLRPRLDERGKKLFDIINGFHA